MKQMIGAVAVRLLEEYPDADVVLSQMNGGVRVVLSRVVGGELQSVAHVAPDDKMLGLAVLTEDKLGAIMADHMIAQMKAGVPK